MRRIGAEQFHPELGKLTLTAFLRPLVTKHLAVIIKLDRQILLHAVGNKRANHSGGAFRPKRKAFAAAVFKTVHFLGNDVAGIAEVAGKHFGKLENRGFYFFKPVFFHHFLAGSHYLLGFSFRRAVQIVSTAHALQFRHNFLSLKRKENSKTPPAIFRLNFTCRLMFRRFHKRIKRNVHFLFG